MLVIKCGGRPNFWNSVKIREKVFSHWQTRDTSVKRGISPLLTYIENGFVKIENDI